MGRGGGARRVVHEGGIFFRSKYLSLSLRKNYRLKFF
jgi:hypothetical protein